MTFVSFFKSYLFFSCAKEQCARTVQFKIMMRKFWEDLTMTEHQFVISAHCISWCTHSDALLFYTVFVFVIFIQIIFSFHSFTDSEFASWFCFCVHFAISRVQSIHFLYFSSSPFSLLLFRPFIRDSSTISLNPSHFLFVFDWNSLFGI